MPTSQGTLKPFVTISRSSELYGTVGYPVGGNVGSSTSATFVATWAAPGVNVINVQYMVSGRIVPGMSVSGIGLAQGTIILGPYNQGGTGNGGVGSYTINLATTATYNNVVVNPSGIAGSVISGTASPSSFPQGPGGIVGPVPGYNCVNIMDIRDYYNLPYPPATPLASPPVIAIVSFGGGIYGQPVTTGQYAGFWKCTDISGNNGAPIQILVAPINGAINAPNADDGGATLENTVDVATVNAFYGMIDPRRDAPIYTPPVIILFIAPSSDISEMYRTFYTVLKNPVVCNGKSYTPTIVSCSWGAPEIAWTQKMPFPPNSSISVDNSPNPMGIAELNEINDLFAEATKNGINICAASGDIPLTNVSSSVNTYNYAQSLLLQGAGGAGYPTGQTATSQVSLFALTDNDRASLPAPKVMFPASSPYVTCVGGSAVYFPSINVGSYANPSEFAWARGNGGISTAFSIPAYQQQVPSVAATSAAQFLASSLNTANLAAAALGTPVPVFGGANNTTMGYVAPNTAVTLATETKESAYVATLNAFNAAQAALVAAQLSDTDDALMNSLVQAVKDCSTALATAEANKLLSENALAAAQDLVVKTDTVSNLLLNAATIFGAAAATTAATANTQQAFLAAQFTAQTAAYNQLINPTTANAIALQNANQAVAAAKVAVDSQAVAAVTLPDSVDSTTDVANKAVAQAAAAVVAPSLSTHPYLQNEPDSSELPAFSNDACNSAATAAADLPYDAMATTAPSYLLATVGLGYKANYADASGNIKSVRADLSDAVTNADNLVDALVNVPQGYDSSGVVVNPIISDIASNTDNVIAESNGQYYDSDAVGANYAAIDSWWTRKSLAEMLPAAGTFHDASGFVVAARNLSDAGAAQISAYKSGAIALSTFGYGYKLPCGLASAAGSALAAGWTVTTDEVNADVAAGNPFGTTDVAGGTNASGTYNGITPGLINLRNIYANTTLMARRTKTAAQAASDSKDAFLAWTSANELVNELSSKATTLYNLIPTPSAAARREMDEKLVAAKTALSAATYVLGVAENYAVTTARLAQQSAASTSVFMGNSLAVNSSGIPVAATFDQLGNLNPVPNTTLGAGGAPNSTVAQGNNNANCPAISKFDASGSVAAKRALAAAQAYSLAAANDKYLTTSVTTWNKHTVTGVDSSSNLTVSLTGTRLLVQDAQYAAANAAAQVANVAFADATESIARFTDWHNVALIAEQANAASALVYLALGDASSNAAGTAARLRQAVDAVNATCALVTNATTPFNQQATPSATLATNDVVVLAAKLENVLNVCVAAQGAIQLAASTYDASGSSNISGSAGQGGSIFVVNMAYAKVTIDAAQAACTAAAILAREESVVAARRANYSAIALQKLVGTDVVGNAIAGFLDASGNLVQQTGYGPNYEGNHPLRNAASYIGENGYFPPAVTTPTILYQGCGGLNLNTAFLDASANPQPSVITNLQYTVNQYNSVYEAVNGLVVNAQAVITALESDSSGNSTQLSSPNEYLTYPNVNAVNALNTELGDSSGNGLVAVQNCLMSAYEAQQWVVASANASFVTFSSSPSNVSLITFTPSSSGIINKLASDASACLETVLNAEAAILYALSLRPNKVSLHDLDASNFAAAFNANQSAADTYLALTTAAIAHEQNTVVAFHKGDLANSLSPLAATAATASGQAQALGVMTWAPPAANPNYASNAALVSANFPASGWGSASMPSLTANLAAQNTNSTNPNNGPYNGILNNAPFPAANASSSSRIQAPSASVLEWSAQLLAKYLSTATLEASKAASDSVTSSLAFNDLMVQVSTVTPSLLDAATKAAQDTLLAAKSANYATSFNNQATSTPQDLSNQLSNLLQQDAEAILAASASANANLDAITPSDARYASRKNMVNLWQIAVNAVAAAVAGSAEAPTNYPDVTNPNTSDPDDIYPVTLGDITIMGETNEFLPAPNNNARTWNVFSDTALYSNGAINYGEYPPAITPAPESSYKPTLLSLLNGAVIDAYNATTGRPDASGNYTFIQFDDASGNPTINIPENVNDVGQAYNNAVAALRANANIKNASYAAVVAAAAAINAAYQAALNTQANLSTIPVDSSGNPVDSSGVTLEYYSSIGSPFAGDFSKITSMAVGFWNCANEFASDLVAHRTSVTLANINKLMAIVGINFSNVTPADSTAAAISAANKQNLDNANIMARWSKGPSTATPAWSAAYGVGGSANLYGQAFGQYISNSSSNTMTVWPTGQTSLTAPNQSLWSAYYFTKAFMARGTVAYEKAYKAWQLVLNARLTFSNSTTTLDTNAINATTAKATAVYSVKLALQAAARAGQAGVVSAEASCALANSTNSYEDLAAQAATEASNASMANLHMYRCVPDIAMHANADDLPVIYRLNGSNVYVGGTSIAAAMFAGFLGVVQSQNPINYFVNPILYDNYTFPSPLFNDISGSLQVWNANSVGGPTVPSRIANILPGSSSTPSSGLGSGLYNCNVGLGSIKAMNLATLMEVPHLVKAIHPNNGDNQSVSVYPGKTAVVRAYVEPITAYNPNLVWSCSSPNATVSQTDGPALSNNGINDTNPYTPYNPRQRDASGNQLASPSPSIGDYALGSVGNMAYGINPFTENPCIIFTATVTGVTAVSAASPAPIVTVTSTDSSNVYGTYQVLVLPAVQVTGVSISAMNEIQNPSNTTLFLGTTLQLVANVTPANATQQRVYWWSSNTAVVNVDASGLLTSLAPGQVTIKATSLNNNISASISVYVPTPITGISVLPSSITLNPNMLAYPLKNLGLIRAVIQPLEADYKHLSWEIVSSSQLQPAPAGICDVISLPRDGTVLSRNSSGDITDNTEATVTALSNGTATLKVSTYGEPYGVYGTYTALVTVNVVTPITDVVMTQGDIVINLNPHTAQYDSSRSLPESYQVTCTLKPAYPSNMNVFWSSSNPKVAVVSNNSAAVLNTVTSDPNFGLWQITETITPLSNGTTVIKVTTADGSKTDVTTVVVTTPVTGISMSALPVTLNPTRLYTLQATVLPTTATNRTLVWESTNTSIATVDANGVVKAVTSGSCGISATTVDGDFSAITEVTVYTPLVGVQLMVNTPLPIHINDVVQILVVMVPTTASNQQFTWTVTDGVDGNIFTTGPPQNGNIVYLDAVQAGNSIFTVTTVDGNKQASINLQVVQW